MIHGHLNFHAFDECPVALMEEFTNPNNKQQQMFYQIHESYGGGKYMLTLFVYEPRNPAFGIQEIHTERMVLEGESGFHDLQVRAIKKRDDATNPPHLGLL